MTQQEWVLKYLKEVGEITPLDAFREFAIMRLSACIYDLRKQGYNIDTDYVTSKNRFGADVTYAKYVYKRKYIVVYEKDNESDIYSTVYAKSIKEVGKEFYKTHDNDCIINEMYEEK